MTLKLFLLYLATWSLVALTPGPAVMCAMSQATRYGFRASLAGITGTQVGTVKSRMHYAKRALRKIIEENET